MRLEIVAAEWLMVIDDFYRHVLFYTADARQALGIDQNDPGDIFRRAKFALENKGQAAAIERQEVVNITIQAIRQNRNGIRVEFVRS